MKKLIAPFVTFSLLMLLAVSGTASVPVITPEETIRQEAMKEWNSLSAKQKRERYKAVKQEIKKYRKEKRRTGAADTDTLLLVILAIILPPLAIYLHQGEINNKFWLGLILTLLFWVPGIIYALIVILGNG
ncbi:YqaE/Pmp3 family membrane protein [Lacibacter sp. MH-610]|uniref:YqaE/Pmp3 family membrane protein n=1 Tax=Lacibacter sp. MH-610 TaxID=3020883 RepID=UPI003891FC7E